MCHNVCQFNVLLVRRNANWLDSGHAQIFPGGSAESWAWASIEKGWKEEDRVGLSMEWLQMAPAAVSPSQHGKIDLDGPSHEVSPSAGTITGKMPATSANAQSKPKRKLCPVASCCYEWTFPGYLHPGCAQFNRTIMLTFWKHTSENRGPSRQTNRPDPQCWRSKSLR